MSHGGKRKGAGRKPGIPNENTLAVKERIERDADPIGFLCKIVNGEAIEQCRDGETVIEWPNVDHRMAAANVLAKKVAPDCKAVEHTGGTGSPIKFEIITSYAPPASIPSTRDTKALPDLSVDQAGLSSLEILEQAA
jgi:hypothetical protein